MKRQPPRDSVNLEKTSKESRRPLRLVLEPLEARRLLAGLNVSVFIDQDGSRSAGAADTVAARRVVFVDLNENGQQDLREAVAFTNERGVASFVDLAPGEYSVGIISSSRTQTQSFPVRVDELATNVAPSSSTLVASADLAQVWAIDDAGRGQVISSLQMPAISTIELKGPVTASITVGGEAWLISRAATDSPTAAPQTLTRLELGTGRQVASEIRGLEGRSIEQLVSTGNRIVAKLQGPRGAELATLALVEGVPTLGRSAAFPSMVAVAGTPSGALAIIQSQAAVVDRPQVGVSPTLSILNGDNFSVRLSTVLPQAANDLAFSFDGKLVIAALTSGGVLVMKNEAGMPPVARLAEASSPLLTQSRDGRIVTGNAGNSRQFIVWDTALWQPIGRTNISSGEQRVAAVAAVWDAVIAASGDRMIATSAAGTFASQLSRATTARAQVPSEGVGSVQLGVRVESANRAPSADPVAVALMEDTVVGGQLRSQVIDANNDMLWFSLLSAPSHGRLELTPTGQWTFSPASNFNGIDHAVVRVFDGQSSSDVAMVLDVTPVNDAPEEMRVELHSVSENVDGSQLGELGYVTVFDADRGARYKFETSDSRFEVRHGRIYLASGTKLDFESEPQVNFEIIATEDAISGYQISTTATLTVADVNEPPTAVRIINGSVAENLAGAVIGKVQVDDPEGSEDFEFLVSDSRFIVVGGYLMLRPGVELDYEGASSISLSLTIAGIQDEPSNDYSLSIAVLDVNDPPSEIQVKTRTVEENSAGAIFGEVMVNDQDGDLYQYTVSDSRFEVVDGQLKLKDDAWLDKQKDNSLLVTVTATSLTSGDTINSDFTVTVGAKKSPFQNPVEPRDVNGDGQITPIDALILINRLNSSGPGRLGGSGARGGSGEGPVWVDVNGDGIFSPLDVLIIINWLNRRRLIAVSETTAEGEAAPPLVSSLVAGHEPVVRISEPELDVKVALMVSLAADSATPTGGGHLSYAACSAVEFSDLKKSNQLDQELELLLDQLSRARLATS